MKAKKICSVETTMSGTFFREDLNTAINKFFLNSKYSSFIDEATSEIVLKPHKNMDKVLTAQNNLCTNVILNIEADLYSDGSLKNFRIGKGI